MLPRGLMLGLILLSTFINDLDDGTEHSLSRYSDNTKRGGVADTPEGCAAIQGDLEMVKKWANLVKFDKGQCEVLPLGRCGTSHCPLLRFLRPQLWDCFSRKMVRCWSRLPRENCGVSVLGDVQNPTGHSPEQPSLGTESRNLLGWKRP